ncbi:hypothetical protein X777_04980 [Ooceraea biroi]|uniref:Uncharacterized protein n=1 Tax=Ooceraea biroi TaxID=2015173 RepID=A0A026WF06_OOCBI|nr:hypothetical protein X777_04980 [Ooceraea biroi]
MYMCACVCISVHACTYVRTDCIRMWTTARERESVTFLPSSDEEDEEDVAAEDTRLREVRGNRGEEKSNVGGFSVHDTRRDALRTGARPTSRTTNET